MIDKDTYKRELVRMWDSLRTTNKCEHSCDGVNCKECPLHSHVCKITIDVFEVYDFVEVVEKWSKEHPPKKHKISQLEYDILKSYLDYKNHMTFDIADYFFEDGLLLSLLKKGYFKGATKEMLIKDYLNDCEVVDDEG